jgi:hypothetical protein
MQTLTRPQLTTALAARQLLLERQRLAPAEAIHLDEGQVAAELGA